MKKLTAYTMFRTAEGTRMSLVYSEIDEQGKVLNSNQRVDRIIMDHNALELANELYTFGQGLIDNDTNN